MEFEIPNQEVYVEYPVDSIGPIFLIKDENEALNQEIKAEASENIEFLGRLFEEVEENQIGCSGGFTVLVPKGSVDDVSEIADIKTITIWEERLRTLYPTTDVLCLYQFKELGLIYSLLNNSKKVQTGLFMADGTMIVSGKLSDIEQAFIDANEDDFTKISKLWYHHFKAITDLDTPYCDEFAGIWMKKVPLVVREG